MQRKMFDFRQLLAFFVIAAAAPVLADSATDPDDWGIHRIWGKKEFDENPEVTGSFVMVFWKDLNPAPGQFDFSAFDDQLKRFDKLGKRVTVAIKGKFKPDYLFDEVPYHPDKLSVGVHDELGSLQYWHPTHMKRYSELLQAFAAYLKDSPYRSTVYSIRLNFNAFGSEQSRVPENARNPNQWIVPPGVTNVPFAEEERSAYKKFVAKNYYDYLSSDFLVLVRTNTFTGKKIDLPSAVLTAIEQGRMGLVHTSSVPEPRSVGTERKYEVHLKYGRNGVTPVYAESFSGTDRDPVPPARWNYWRILSDLHSGVSYIAVYGSDIAKGTDAEFKSAFDFGNRYAGYQTKISAASSPGAWVALREGGQFLKGDYTFLMSRMAGDDNIAVESIGPEWQRYGYWARRVNAGGRMRFELDNRFANSLRSGDVTVRITYYNSGSPNFVVETPNSKSNVAGGSTGTWKTKEIVVPAAEFSGNAGPDITLHANSNVVVHMVEISRSDAIDISQTQAPPKSPSGISVN